MLILSKHHTKKMLHFNEKSAIRQEFYSTSYIHTTSAPRTTVTILVEHNLDVIKNADWIIDIGPEGGDEGGYIVAEGTPEDIAGYKKSCTGKYLKECL